MSKAGKIFFWVWLASSGLTLLGLIGRDGYNEGPFGGSFPEWFYDFALAIGIIFLSPTLLIYWTLDLLHLDKGYYRSIIFPEEYNPVGIILNGLYFTIIIFIIWTVIKKIIHSRQRIARQTKTSDS